MTTTLIFLIAFSATSALAGKPGRRAQTAINLNQGLQGSPMQGTGFALERAGWRHRVSPYFIAAIAATESSLGRAACYSDRFNAFGLASCTHSWPVPRFRSWAHVYDFMGAFLTRRWPHADTAHEYFGYAACSACWGRRTAWFMRSLFGVGASVRYP